MPTLLIPIFVCFPSAMAALLCVNERVVIIPVIVNLPGNAEINISTRLGTTKFNAPMLVEIGQSSAHSSAFTTSLSIPRDIPAIASASGNTTFFFFSFSVCFQALRLGATGGAIVILSLKTGERISAL